MKINGTLLALCAFSPNVWGSSAFGIVQAPKARSSALFSSLNEGVGLGVSNQVSPKVTIYDIRWREQYLMCSC